MIGLFLLSLFTTLFVIRLFAYKLHDMKNYDQFNPKNSNAKTITGLLRRKTGFDWHHIHFGLIILLFVVPFILFIGINKISIIFLAMGLSMVIDQATPLVNRKSNYFSRKNLIISLMFHIISGLIAIIILWFLKLRDKFD